MNLMVSVLSDISFLFYGLFNTVYSFWPPQSGEVPLFMGSKCGPNFHRFLPSLLPSLRRTEIGGEYLAPDRIFPDIIIDDFRPLLLRPVRHYDRGRRKVRAPLLPSSSSRAIRTRFSGKLIWD